MSATHKCPKRGCNLAVPNRLFACRQHWAMLSGPVQQAIHATAFGGSTLHARAEAVQAAREEWGTGRERHPAVP